jgi:Glyoxalase-like domain
MRIPKLPEGPPLVRNARSPPSVLTYGWDDADDLEGGMALLPTDDTGFGFRFRPTREQKTGQNPTHFHLTSTSLEDQQQTVAMSLGLGARHIDVGQRPEEGHVVLADPESNEFWVIEPGSNYLAGYGGPKISWDGKRVKPKTGKNWHHLDLAPPIDGEQQTEVDRLVSLGAARVDIGQAEVSWVVMADPGGQEFCVLTPRLEVLGAAHQERQESATPDIHDLAVDQMVASGLEGGSRAAQLRVNTKPGWPSGVSGPCPAGCQPPAM